MHCWNNPKLADAVQYGGASWILSHAIKEAEWLKENYEKLDMGQIKNVFADLKECFDRAEMKL